MNPAPQLLRLWRKSDELYHPILLEVDPYGLILNEYPDPDRTPRKTLGGVDTDYLDKVGVRYEIGPNGNVLLKGASRRNIVSARWLGDYLQDKKLPPTEEIVDGKEELVAQLLARYVETREERQAAGKCRDCDLNGIYREYHMLLYPLARE